MLRRLFAFFALIGIVAAAACNDNAVSTLIAPITGIEIRSEALTAGLGCGTSPPQVYKYVALVYGSAKTSGIVDRNVDLTAPISSAVFDCFSDGAFVQLPASNGSFQYRLELYVYAGPAYERSRAILDPITGIFNNVTDSVDGGRKALRDILLSTNPTWTTQCFATQQDLVEVLAVCDPLTSADGGGSTVVQLPTNAFARADGTTISCDPGNGGVVVEPPSPDAGEDADAGDAAVDASDAASDAGADAGPAKTYKTVRVRTRIDQKQVGDQVDLACPTAFLLSPAEPLTKYTFDVGLLDEAGNTVGLTTCTAAAEPGSASTATCNPVP